MTVLSYEFLADDWRQEVVPEEPAKPDERGIHAVCHDTHDKLREDIRRVIGQRDAQQRGHAYMEEQFNEAHRQLQEQERTIARLEREREADAKFIGGAKELVRKAITLLEDV